MKPLIFAALLLPLGAMAATPAHTDPATGLKFPDKLGGLDYVKV